MKQSFVWWPFANTDTDARRLLVHAKKIGYQGVELIDQKYWDHARNAGLRIVSMMAHDSLTEGLNRRDQFASLEQGIRTNFALARKWDIPHLICFSGNRYGPDDGHGAEIIAENLRRLAPLAEDTGVTLVLELLNSKVDHPNYQCDRTWFGVRVCELTCSPRIKLLYDIYHMQVMEGDIIRTIQKHHPHFGHYHTAGNPGRHDLDDAQELNYPAIMRAIQATGYRGYIGQEFIPKGEPVAALEHAFKVCRMPS